MCVFMEHIYVFSVWLLLPSLVECNALSVHFSVPPTKPTHRIRTHPNQTKHLWVCARRDKCAYRNDVLRTHNLETNGTCCVPKTKNNNNNDPPDIAPQNAKEILKTTHISILVCTWSLWDGHFGNICFFFIILFHYRLKFNNTIVLFLCVHFQHEKMHNSTLNIYNFLKETFIHEFCLEYDVFR